jgi:hypothetical protein
MDAIVAYVVSGTVVASAVTPVDTRTHIAGSPIDLLPSIRREVYMILREFRFLV